MSPDEGENGDASETAGRSANSEQNTYPPSPARKWTALHLDKLKHVGLHEWLMIAATVVMAASTTAYAIYAGRQLKTMENATFMTSLAIGQTQHMINQAIEQTQAAHVAASAAKSAADTAADALRQSIQQFRLDQRPWIEIQIGEPVLRVAEDNTFPASYKYTFGIKNTGKTTAFDIQCRVPRQGFGASKFFGDNPKIDLNKGPDPFSGVSEADRIVLLSERMPQVLGPSTASLTNLELFGQAPKNGLFNYLTGRIDYTDAFAEKHWTTFCFFVELGGTLRYCRIGNEKDRNYETLPNMKR
ncbi:MAG: hypothetical protein ABSF25_05540 [Bryobacteraceae bacterium]|jgi:hypothetical protein